MTASREGFRRLQDEIVAEKAAALGRAGERLDSALRRVEALGRALDEAGDTATRERLSRQYDAARRDAHHARLTLLIQREAVGLRQHHLVDQQFPEPPRRRV